MKQNIFILTLLPLLLYSCGSEEFSSDNNGVADTGTDAIVFSIGFAESLNDDATRVATDADFKSTWEDGDAVGVFAVKHGEPLTASGNYIHNAKLTYNDTSWTTPSDLYWLNDGATLDFYAYYPYDANMNPTAYAFSVQTDQRGSNYTLSDLMTAESSDYSKGSTVLLVFSHVLSMVQVDVPSPGKGFGPGADLTLYLRNAQPAATLNLNNIGDTSTNEVSLSTTESTTAITMYRVEQEGDDNYETAYTYRALVPAQRFVANQTLFWLSHENRQLFDATVLGADLTLVPGKAKRYEVSLPVTVLHHAVEIPAGEFEMGQEDATAATPVHTVMVTLTKAFYMSKYLITNAQYAAFLNARGIGSNGQGTVDGYDGTQRLVNEDQWGVAYDNGTSSWQPSTGYADYPVVGVTWYGAKAYADWVGGSLPTEAQWEYACRAGTTTAYSYGETANADYMWYYANSNDQTHPVGEKRPNLWGLYDMHGNVFEWCADWYGVYSGGDVTDPTGPADGSYRVLRGGSWRNSAQGCRSAYRDSDGPGNAGSISGFRVVFVL